MTAGRFAARCSRLVKRYGDVTAVAGLDLEVLRGECLGLLGPNGAGKTTTVEILEGLTRPDAGRVEILDLAWGAGQDDRIRQRIGVQLQDSQLGDKLTVTEVLRLFASLYERSRPLEQLIDWFELGPKRHTRIHQLSGGQRQRVALACALVSDPDLLFLDEPTTGLDPQARRKVWDVISEYKRGGGTVLITSHYMEECEQLCDRVAILDRGQRIALGSPDELVQALGAKQVVEFQLRQRKAEGAALTEPPAPLLDAFESQGLSFGAGWFRFKSDAVSRSLPRLLEVAGHSDAEVTALRTHEPTLEDVFLALTGRSLRDD